MEGEREREREGGKQKHGFVPPLCFITIKSHILLLLHTKSKKKHIYSSSSIYKL